MDYETLFTPVELGPVQLKNRIMSSGHQTTLVHDYLPTDDFFSYHLARAEGGVGLAVLEAHAVHESGLLTDHTIDASSDDIIDAYRPFAADMNEAGSRVFAQLFHGGREVYGGEYAPPPPSASDIPTDRLHAIPRPLETTEVYELIESFVAGAERMAAAGIDGVEIVGSHGYLPAQFWSPHTNQRDDEFGGSLEARCRFTGEIVKRIRKRVGDDLAVGVRLSTEERHERGLTFNETLPIIEYLDGQVDLDYWSIVVGSSSTHRSCSFIVPPATEGASIVRDPGAVIKKTVDSPVIVTSRINTPEKAESIVAEGTADVVGMTRALIADPDLPRKITTENRPDVTPCVACNQGCIGRYQKGLPIRCTVNPETGREREYRDFDTIEEPKNVLVVGGGPAGLVAASTASQRGHEVTLVEQENQLGGQVLSYADLDHRGQYREWIRVLERRVREAGTTLHLGTRFNPDDLEEYDADDVVLATGADGRIPDIPISEGASVTTAIETLQNPDTVTGEYVMISDWDGNWASLDVARLLANRDDVDIVEIVTSAYSAGEAVQQYVQNRLLGELYEAGVRFTPHHRIGRVNESSVSLVNIFTEDSKTQSDVDTIVFSHVGEAEYSLFRDLQSCNIRLHRVGDCWAPRSLDEATWEAYRTAIEL